MGGFEGSRASPGGVHARCFRQSGPQRVPESDFVRFGLHFVSMFVATWVFFDDFQSFSHTDHRIFTGFSENAQGNSERTAGTELRPFTSCLILASAPSSKLPSKSKD